MIYPVYLAEAEHHFANGRHCRWRPSGPLYAHVADSSAAEAPPMEILGEGGNLSARFFVGLKVGQEERWTPKDVSDIVYRVRKAQGARPDASILLQLGIYEDHGERVNEPSVQVVIIDIENTPRHVFLHQMQEVGEALARELQQREVILELQKGGIVQAVFTVTP